MRTYVVQTVTGNCYLFDCDSRRGSNANNTAARAKLHRKMGYSLGNSIEISDIRLATKSDKITYQF